MRTSTHPALETVTKMTKEELVRKLAACDAAVEELKSQIRRLQARLEEVERDRRSISSNSSAETTR